VKEKLGGASFNFRDMRPEDVLKIKEDLKKIRKK